VASPELIDLLLWHHQALGDSRRKSLAVLGYPSPSHSAGILSVRLCRLI
jgi:hypothetical protein